MRTPVIERLLSLRLLPMHQNPTLSKWLLLGGPGIGKSYVTKSALVRLMKLLFFSWKAIEEGSEDVPSLPYSEEEGLSEFLLDEETMEYLREEAEKALKDLIRVSDVEKLCRCIQGAVLLYKEAVLERRKVGFGVASSLAKENKAIETFINEILSDALPKLEDEIKKELQFLSEETEYAKQMKEDMKALLQYVRSKEGAWVKPILKDKFKKAIVKSLIARVIKPKNVDFIVIEYDTEIPMVVYEDAVVYVSKNMGATDVTELAGLPNIATEGGVDFAELTPTRWAYAVRKALFGLVNLDEFTNQMPTMVQSLSYALTLWETAGSFAFRKPVVATGNTRQTSSLVGDLPGPLVTGRLSMIMVDPPYVEEWIEYMNRKHGNNWSLAVKLVVESLTTRTKEENLMKVAKESEAFEQVIRTITYPFSDVFYPPDEELERYSNIEPGVSTGFPSPRAWESVAVIIKEYEKLYDNEDVLATAVKSEIYSIGLPIIAEVIAHLVMKEKKFKNINITEFVKAINVVSVEENLTKRIKEIVDAFANKNKEERNKIASQFAKELFSIIMDMNLLALVAINCFKKESEECENVTKKINEIIDWFNKPLETKDMYRKLAHKILKSVMNKLLKIYSIVITKGSDYISKEEARRMFC